ncbi:WASH complex subunit 4 [Balamuthia mandrillaris]
MASVAVPAAVGSSTTDEEYYLDPFDDGSSRLVGQKLLGKLQGFVKDFAGQLKAIETALEESLSEVWDSTVDPIALSLQPYEQTRIFELIKTDNKLFNKMMIVFASLCVEMRTLSEEALDKFAAPFLTFGEQKEPAEGEAQVQIGRMLNPFLIEFSNFVSRVYTVAQNVIRQLASLYHPKQKLFQSSFKGIHLASVFEHLGDLLVSLLSLDQIITSNQVFTHSWAMYKRMTKMAREIPGKYAADEVELAQFEKLILSLEGQLFDGLLFQNCIQQEFDFPGLVEVRRNSVFQAEFQASLRSMLAGVAKRLGQGKEGKLRYRYMGLCALYVLYFSLYRDVEGDKAFFKQLWELHTKVPVIHLAGNALWFAPEFFIKNVPVMVKTLGKIAVSKFRQSYLASLDKSFPAYVQQLYLQTSVWMVRMESNLTNRADTSHILATRLSLLAQAPALGYRIGNLFKSCVYMHITLNVPLKKRQLRYLFQCVELLKAIHSTCHRRSAMIGESISYMMQQVSFRLQQLLLPIKQRLETNKKYSDAKLDVLAAVTLALQMLNGCATRDRLLVLHLCFHVLSQPEFLKESEMESIKGPYKQLELLCHLSEKIREACECNFIYWSRNMIPLHFKDIYENPEHAHKLHYLFAALQDVVPLFRRAVFKPYQELLDEYKQATINDLKEEILDRLCRDIETDLRLHIHSHLNVSERDPWKTGLRDLVSLIRVKPLRVFDNTIDVKSYVSHYLDTTFYNLNTVALYDWKTYEEMRNLAKEKYGLGLAEVHLPGQTLEQGLDVLEIMRNIHIFVAKYTYNLNNQIFVEASTINKTLNTINISHISNSIRTHGTGIMNTTVNFTYQFLRQKFVIFSQFLYDEQIKARLYKDIRYFKENKDKLGNHYPFERAQTFNKEIRNLGLTESGLTYLDQFRILITEIGNAMGYIRMIRSGGLYYTSNAIKFVPDLQEIPSFTELANQATLPPHTIEAASNLDQTIDDLATNFAEGTEYFKMLVNVFASEFRDSRNVHLKNFHIIVPPLTLNFVTHILLSKDKLFKKNTKEGTFCDDGFAMGLAYILKLLDQYTDFDSLHWWESVKHKYKKEQDKLNAMAKQKGKDKEDQQTLALTLKKLSAHQREFELLRFTFNGARIFFKD